MTVREIILAHLRQVGADGLCCEGCGCDIEELAPCCVYTMACIPGKRVVATEAGDSHEIGDEIFVPMEKEDKE
jgi:hypothetical protein